MCLICVKYKDVALPDRQYLHNGYKNNPDGVGVALLKNNKNIVEIKKDFKDFDNFYKWVVNNINVNDLAIIHFRLATSGKTDMGNRHPFPITHNKILLRKTEVKCRFAVAHNGVLSDYSYKKEKKYSDTQKFILDILADLKYKIHNPAVQKLIEKYIISDKLAIIDSIRRDIILLGNYDYDNGIYWSNSGYLYDKTNVKTYGNAKTKPSCELCESTRKVKWVSKEKALLCKKCRKGLRKHGWEKWWEILEDRWEQEDAEWGRYNIDNYDDIEKQEYKRQRQHLEDFCNTMPKSKSYDKFRDDIMRQINEDTGEYYKYKYRKYLPSK